MMVLVCSGGIHDDQEEVFERREGGRERKWGKFWCNWNVIVRMERKEFDKATLTILEGVCFVRLLVDVMSYQYLFIFVSFF